MPVFGGQVPAAAVGALIGKQALPMEEIDVIGTALCLDLRVILGKGLTCPADAALAFICHLTAP